MGKAKKGQTADEVDFPSGVYGIEPKTLSELSEVQEPKSCLRIPPEQFEALEERPHRASFAKPGLSCHY